MTETNTYQPGDEVRIAPGVTITLGARRGSHGVRWNWSIPATDEMGGTYEATPELAIAHAIKTMNTPECRHGERGWCPNCHDASNR